MTNFQMIFFSLFFYILAAFMEIAGCFTFWLYFRLHKSFLWLFPGILCLLIFAFSLTKIEFDYAGRAYAIYGGIYIFCTLIWLWLVEGTQPDRWDLIGVALCITGASVMLFCPRG